MSLYSKGKKEALTYPKKRYNNVVYEKQGPSLPKANSNINSKITQERTRKSNTNLSFFG